MQTQLTFKIQLSEFQSFSWPVKIRVRAAKNRAAPRKPQVLPASFSFEAKPKTVLRTLETPRRRVCRRASNRLEWSNLAATVSAGH